MTPEPARPPTVRPTAYPLADLAAATIAGHKSIAAAVLAHAERALVGLDAQRAALAAQIVAATSGGDRDR